ncbi:MAG: outer membrane beta-barrel protein [Pseudomonadales bacterium]
MTIKTNLSAALLAAGLASAGAAYADDMSYTYVEGGYLMTDIDNVNVDGDGLGIAASAALNEMFFVFGDYATQEFDNNIDYDQFQLGLGGHWPITEVLDVVGTVSYVDAELDAGPANADDSGFGLGLGLRGRLTDVVELEGGINYYDLDDAGDDTQFNVGGRYYFTPAFAVGAGVQMGDDFTTWKISARYEFR